jgi:organic radical activating enzyme|tara:strand:+ start:1715 stop:2695 length:981 start_codon:yes stop_codon:yes gene_type:complete
MRYPAHFPDDHPDDPRTLIPNIEFYITNVCNIACPQCNRFNNWNFKGHQIWKDYEAIYEQWATKIRLQRICILGGEPLMNPSIVSWVKGMNKIFKKKVQILTNGTRLNHVKGLYDSLHFEYKDENEFDNNWIGVSVHNANDIDRHFEEGYKFLQGEVTKYDGTRNTNNNATWGADYALVDENGIRLHYWIENQFTQAAVQRNPLTERFELHKSDPQQAHDECSFVHHQCHHFINGKLYKCGPVGIMPEFDDQLKFDISEDDRKILHSYEPLSVHEFAQRGKQFIDNIDEVIDQCKFCPSNRKPLETIESLNKKRFSTSSFKDVIKE